MTFDRLGMSGRGGGAVTAKVSGAKRRAFLKAYRQSGNSTLAAERAGVSRSWVSLARRGDRAFDLECRAAKAASAERLGASGRNRPPGAWRNASGVDLVVQRAGRRAPQVVRSLRARWTARAEDRFLGELRRCNNIALACGRAGMTVSSYEAHRRRWPDFRRRIEEARRFAGMWLSGRSAAAAGPPFELEVSEALEAVPTIDERIRLARRHKGRG
jgi:hypothetical protein